MNPILDIPIIRRPDWPAADRLAWNQALSAPALFEPAGRLNHYTPDRLDALADAYGRWLGFLALEYPDRQPPSGLAEGTRDLVERFYRRLAAKLAPYTVRNYLRDLLIVVEAVAPGKDHKALVAVSRYTSAVAEPVGNKRPRMVHARDLFQLGLDLMQAASSRSTLLQQLSSYRDGLMIAVLIARPLRLGNFTAIEIGRHLNRNGNMYCLAIPGVEVKTRRPLEFSLPAELTSAMDCYLEERRPQLLKRRGRWWRGDPGKAFWISEDGTAMRAKRVADRIRQRTHERFGKPINPHLFRDIAATSIAIDDPKHVTIIRPLLGHADHRTGEQYYNQARSLEAARRFHSILEGLGI